MKRILLTLSIATAVLIGGACTETDVAELDSASACLDAAAAGLDVYQAGQLGRSSSDMATLRAKASRLDAECDAAKNHELDLKTE